jgi:CBS domain-containing protein
MSKNKKQVDADSLALHSAYFATYDVDELLIKLVGNLTLRDVALAPVERALLDAAILKLAEARRELKTIDPKIYLA